MNIDPNLPSKPPGPDLYTERRWQHSALRRRMLCGDWSDDLHKEMGRHFNIARRAVIGLEDTSSNVFKMVTSALNALYNEPPAIGIYEEEESLSGLLGGRGLLARSGLWSIMQRVSFLTIGIRECFVKCEIYKDDLVFIPITPDYIYAESHPSNPMRPILIAHLKLRQTNKKPIWTYDVFDIRDSENPSFRVVEVERNGAFGRDLSDIYIGSVLEGENYPYRKGDGSPILPFSLYHAQLNGDSLFDPFSNSELVAGSLSSACLHTFLLHMAKSTAWPQRWIMGCGIGGGTTYNPDDASRRVSIATDPSSILVFSPDPDMQSQPMIGQFNTAGDPVNLMSMIISYERKLAQSGGIRPGSVQKISSDPRSGVAIAMSRSDQRDAQRRFKPSFSRGDQNTISLAAIMSNRFLGSNYLEEGYRIEYQTIPMSKDEMEAIRNDTIEKEKAGLISKIQAIKVFNPDLSDQEASKYLREIKRQQIEFALTI